MVFTQLLINFAQFLATGRLCSNLPNCAATPKNTKIRLFEAKWQLLPKKKHCCSNPMAFNAFRLFFTSVEPSAATKTLCSNLPNFAAFQKLLKFVISRQIGNCCTIKNIGSSFMTNGAFMHIFHIC